MKKIVLLGFLLMSFSEIQGAAVSSRTLVPSDQGKFELDILRESLSVEQIRAFIGSLRFRIPKLDPLSGSLLRRLLKKQGMSSEKVEKLCAIILAIAEKKREVSEMDAMILAENDVVEGLDNFVEKFAQRITSNPIKSKEYNDFEKSCSAVLRSFYDDHIELFSVIDVLHYKLYHQARIELKDIPEWDREQKNLLEPRLE